MTLESDSCDFGCDNCDFGCDNCDFGGRAGRGSSLFPLPSSLFLTFNTEALKSQRDTEDFSFSAPSLCESLFLCASVLKNYCLVVIN